MSWRGVWLRAQITGLLFSSMIWLVVGGLSLPAAALVVGAGVVWLLVRDTRAGLWWRYGARLATRFERVGVQAAIVPVGSLRGRHQPRIWIGARTGPGGVVVPNGMDLVVSPSLVRRIVSGELGDEQASALVAHALGQRPVWRSLLVAAVDVYCLPWNLVEIVVAAFTATAGRSGVMSASWKMRWLVFGVAIVDNVHAARWNALVPLMIVAVLSGTTAVLRRRWLAALRDLGDRQVIIEGLGPVLAAMIRSRSRSVSDLARADTLDQRHTGRDAELQPAVRKRACR
jgi:hypothetical protein